MSRLREGVAGWTRRRGLSLVVGAAVLLGTQGCVSPGVSSMSVSYGVGFYQPWGFDYGAWGPRYYVGPPRRGGPWRPPPRRAGPPAFRPPLAGRPMPSLPLGRPPGGIGRGPGPRGPR